MATAAALAAIRAHVGSEPADDELDAMYAQLGTVEAVAHAVLGKRLADMQAKPAEVNYDGDVTERWAENMKALERKMAGLARAPSVTTPGMTTAGRLVRRGIRR